MFVRKPRHIEPNSVSSPSYRGNLELMRYNIFVAMTHTKSTPTWQMLMVKYEKPEKKTEKK